MERRAMSRDDTAPVSTDTKKRILKTLKAKASRAETLLRDMIAQVEADSTAHEGFWAEDQRDVAALIEAKGFRDRADDPAEREEHAERVREIEERRQRKQDAYRSRRKGRIGDDGVNRLLNFLNRIFREGREVKDVSPSIPSSIDECAKLLDSTRSQIAKVMKKIEKTRNGPVSVEDAMARIDRDLDAFFESGRPILTGVIREELLESGRGRPGETRWPRVWVGGGKYMLDGFALTCWLHKDLIRKKLESEVKALIGSSPITPMSERPAAIAKLKTEILKLERVEEALVRRLIAAGRTDIGFRHDLMHPEARLGIKVGVRV
jgi:hypothetical protein